MIRKGCGRKPRLSEVFLFRQCQCGCKRAQKCRLELRRTRIMPSQRDVRAASWFLYVLFFLAGLALLSTSIKEQRQVAILICLAWVGLMLPRFFSLIRSTEHIQNVARITDGVLLLVAGLMILATSLKLTSIATLLTGLYLAVCGAFSLWPTR